MSEAPEGGALARGYARAVVALRWPLALGWIAALAAAMLFLPGLGGSGSAPLSDIVPSDAPAITAQQQALGLFGSSIATDTVTVERNPRGLSRAALAAQVRGARDAGDVRGVRAAVPFANLPVPGVRWNERDTTAVTYLFLGSDLNLEERSAAARAYLASVPPSGGGERGISGAGPARLAQWHEIDDALPLTEAATVLVIALVVALYFRAVGAPLVTLATAALGYLVAVRALAWAGEQTGNGVPNEIEPVLVVLLLGLATDYTVFFMSETRRRLRLGASRLDAARVATTRVAPLVFAAGTLVTAGALSLLAGELRFFRVFGPGLAVAALLVTVVCLTFVPAVMAIAGPLLFGRRIRDEGRRAAADRGDDHGPAAAAPPPARRGAQRLLTARPVAALVALTCAGLLVVAALGMRSASLSVSFIPSLPAGSEPRAMADAAGAGFAPGILAPTELVLQGPGIGARTAALQRLQALYDRDPGVAAVLGPGQTGGAAPGGVVTSRDGDAARLVLVLDHEPTTAAAIATIRRLERRTPELLTRAGLPGATRAAFAGESALSAETVDAMLTDLRRVVIVTIAVTLVLLALFLRAVVAPVLLLAGSVLALAGSLGLTSLLLPHLLDTHDIVYYVPLVGAVMLVGLGSDYNVFIAGRIREETERRGLRDAVAAGTRSASRAITVAGVTLAATFALLAIVPLLAFRELALLMSLGVLLDALVVRSVLIPALIVLSGRLAWWPRVSAAASPPASPPPPLRAASPPPPAPRAETRSAPPPP